jgi:phage-related protein
VGDAGDVHVDSLALKGDALGLEVLALALPDREAAVGADDPPPRHVVGVLSRENARREARRAGRDVAVGPHEPLGDLADRLDDRLVALVVDAEVLHGRARQWRTSGIALDQLPSGANSIQPELVPNMERRFRQAPEQGGRTQSSYYRDARGVEPVDRFIKGLPLKQATKIDQQIAEHLNGRPAEAPPPEFPITSQIEGELRELRIRFAGTRYRVLYQRSENLIVLNAFEKNVGPVPPSETAIARWRMADFKRRMNAKPRKPPRAAGRDAPAPRRPSKP